MWELLMLDAEMKRSLSAVLSRLVNLTWLQTIKGKHCVQFLIGERYLYWLRCFF